MNDTIWVVDDDRSVRFVLATALSEAGFEVVGFDAAAAVLDALATRPPPQLLFTDVRMPGDDGLVLLDRLKHAHPRLPVVVMSAYPDVASTEIGRAACGERVGQDVEIPGVAESL